MISYAQNFEDVILERALGPRSDGFYVDVGAGDPDYLSVTRWFYDQGWSGINIEPNQAFFNRLVEKRPRDTTLNIGASDTRGTLEFTEAAVGELSSFDAAAASAGGVRRQVPVAPLDEILSEHAGGRAIDFLKIDVEGWELPVLSGIDLSRFRPTILLVEAVPPEGRTESHQSWEPLVTGQAYSMVLFDGLNRFYLADEQAELADAFRLPPGVFDAITPAEVVRLDHHVRLLTGAVRKVANLVVPALRLADEPALHDVVHLISEVGREAALARMNQSRLLIACDELINALATTNLEAVPGFNAPAMDRALVAIRLATEIVAETPPAGPPSPDPETAA